MKFEDFKVGEIYIFEMHNHISIDLCVDTTIQHIYMKIVKNITTHYTTDRSFRLSKEYFPYYRPMSQLEKLKYL